MRDHGRAYGVYVHIPFCAHRCDYCDFATWTDRSHLMVDYVEACVADYRARSQTSAVPPATTVFFGGGTPSLLPSELLVELLGEIVRVPDAEVSVECNPDSVDEAKLRAYRDAGVTRVSLGVQSMVPHVLEALGRTHDPSNVMRAAELAASMGFDSWSVDLIYGSPAESDRDWASTVAATLELRPPHVSAYALTVEPATPMGRRVAVGEVAAPDEDAQATRYTMVDEQLVDAGFEWYEISNWSLPGHQCRHNSGYWNGSEFLALGCAAHGSTDGERWWNVRTPERYIDRIRSGNEPVVGRERLDGAQREEEDFALRLRTRAGVPAMIDDARIAREVATLAEAGMLTERDRTLTLTTRGRLLATDVTVRLLAVGAARGLAAGTRYD